MKPFWGMALLLAWAGCVPVVTAPDGKYVAAPAPADAVPVVSTAPVVVWESGEGAASLLSAGGGTVEFSAGEFSDDLLANRPVPMEPPAALPPVLAEKDQWRGSQCGITQPSYLTFRDADAWQRFWEKGMAPYARRFREVPEVDFSRDMVVGVFLGEKPQPVYGIEIAVIQQEAPPADRAAGRLLVYFRSVDLWRGVFVPPFAVQPFHLRRVPRFAGRVVFVEMKKR